MFHRGSRGRRYLGGLIVRVFNGSGGKWSRRGVCAGGPSEDLVSEEDQGGCAIEAPGWPSGVVYHTPVVHRRTTEETMAEVRRTFVGGPHPSGSSFVAWLFLILLLKTLPFSVIFHVVFHLVIFHPIIALIVLRHSPNYYLPCTVGPHLPTLCGSCRLPSGPGTER